MGLSTFRHVVLEAVICSGMSPRSVNGVNGFTVEEQNFKMTSLADNPIPCPKLEGNFT